MGALSRRSQNKARTGAELVTLAISICLLGGLVGGLVWLELSRGDTPVQVQVKPDYKGAYEYHGDWYLPVTVTNTGDAPTDMLTVALERPIEGEQPETSELQWQFVAGGASVDGTATFDERPTPDTIEVDVISSTDP